jgi:hypothetical protein
VTKELGLVNQVMFRNAEEEVVRMLETVVLQLLSIVLSIKPTATGALQSLTELITTITCTKGQEEVVCLTPATVDKEAALFGFKATNLTLQALSEQTEGTPQTQLIAEVELEAQSLSLPTTSEEMVKSQSTAVQLAFKTREVQVLPAR